MKGWPGISVVLLITFSVYSFPSNNLQGYQPHAVGKERLQQDLVQKNQDEKLQLAKFKDFFELEPVNKTLKTLGVDQNEMQARISVLSTQELRMLEERVDLITEQYEGGMGTGMVIGLVILAVGVIILVVTLDQLYDN